MEPYSNKNRTKLKEIPEENIIDGNNITNQNNDENKEYIISKKIIKPLDLQNFDISSHLHKISHYMTEIVEIVLQINPIIV